jgi:hypothetical protein
MSQDRVRIRNTKSKRPLAPIFDGAQTGRVLRTYPKLGVVIVEFDEDHIFRLRIDEVERVK